MKNKFWKKMSLFLMLATLALVFTACNKKDTKKNAGVNVVTTTNVYGDIAKQVVGKYGTVTPLISNGDVDPHDFEPTTKTAHQINKADLVIANGLGYDSWANRLAKANHKKIVDVGSDIMHFKKDSNPHIWYDLKMPKKYVNYLVDKLGKIDPKHKSQFKENGMKYLKKITKLQEDQAQINGKNSKPVFVSEPVFDYMLEDTGFKIADKDFEEAVENETDPSAKVIQQMNKAINDKQIAFFVNNTQASSSTVNSFVRLAKKSKIPVIEVRETMPNGVSYVNWMQDNINKLMKVSKQ